MAERDSICPHCAAIAGPPPYAQGPRNLPAALARDARIKTAGHRTLGDRLRRDIAAKVAGDSLQPRPWTRLFPSAQCLALMARLT
jgi:hypothetical protein